ncbi:MAG TPA: molybdopterin-dependent oxidoreductase [Nitrospirota bacterium]|nr:molybdopterin-dependent oxidoreductase [Nitrospirota bacterium]
MKMRGAPGVLIGSVVGALLTAALIAVFYAGWRLADLPFVPFDVFDWTTRVLPGALIEFVIGAMVVAIRGLHLGPTSAVAKIIEQAMGIVGLFITGVVAGAVLFSVIRALRGRYAYVSGFFLGLLAAIPAVLISSFLGKTAVAPPMVNALWILFVFSSWGMTFGVVYLRLSDLSVSVERDSDLQPSVQQVNRRKFLIRLAGYTATITVSGAIVGLLSERHSRMKLSSLMPWSATHALPNAGAAVKPAPGTRPEFTPLERHYRIDINTTPPKIDGMTWRLKIRGMVEKPLSFTLDDIQRYEPMHQFVTLSCISNPVGGDLIGTTRWTGVSLKSFLPDLGLKPNATHLKISSADGFWETLPLETIMADERVMLAYAWDGVPLHDDHGFPLRVYIPDVHGMKQPKWIESIEAMDHWEPGYWVVRGWDKVAKMKATSVIDTIAVDMTIISADQRKLVPIGGIAHAGARGISKVEVQVDDSSWQAAAIRTPLSQTTWVIWRYDWPFQPGKHNFTVRCYDGSGTPQIVEAKPPAPSGASGLFSKSQKF